MGRGGWVVVVFLICRFVFHYYCFYLFTTHPPLCIHSYGTRERDVAPW